jgi:hypothetical protein
VREVSYDGTTRTCFFIERLVKNAPARRLAAAHRPQANDTT